VPVDPVSPSKGSALARAGDRQVSGGAGADVDDAADSDRGFGSWPVAVATGRRAGWRWTAVERRWPISIAFSVSVIRSPALQEDRRVAAAVGDELGR